MKNDLYLKYLYIQDSALFLGPYLTVSKGVILILLTALLLLLLQKVRLSLCLIFSIEICVQKTVSYQSANKDKRSHERRMENMFTGQDIENLLKTTKGNEVSLMKKIEKVVLLK